MPLLTLKILKLICSIFFHSTVWRRVGKRNKSSIVDSYENASRTTKIILSKNSYEVFDGKNVIIVLCSSRNIEKSYFWILITKSAIILKTISSGFWSRFLYITLCIWTTWFITTMFRSDNWPEAELRCYR